VKGITAFIVLADMSGVQVESYEWTLNMSIDHATVGLENVRVPSSAVLGEVGSGLSVAQAFHVREPYQTAIQ
jgi:alkylation response protein AidB-like acyl-CoA dehydrogenase